MIYKKEHEKKKNKCAKRDSNSRRNLVSMSDWEGCILTTRRLAPVVEIPTQFNFYMVGAGWSFSLF